MAKKTKDDIKWQKKRQEMAINDKRCRNDKLWQTWQKMTNKEKKPKKWQKIKNKKKIKEKISDEKREKTRTSWNNFKLNPKLNPKHYNIIWN